MSDSEILIESAVRRLRIIIGALMLGVLIFTAIVILLTTLGDFSPADSNTEIFLIALPTLAFGCATAFGLFRRAQDTRLRERAPIMSDQQVLLAHSTRTIVGAAMAESVALLSGVAYLLTGNVWLILGIVAALFAMTTFLPSEQKLRLFMQRAGRDL